jgi:fructose-1,6-bisphosphatase I
MELGATLESITLPVDPEAGDRSAAARAALVHMAGAAVSLSTLLARPPLSGRLGATTGEANSDGDKQRKLDLIAEDLFRDALKSAGVGAYLSEEVEDAGLLNAQGLVAVAIDPLDGSSNIDVNAPVGTVFSILPMPEAAMSDPAAAFRQTGRSQIAAGFFIYGPQTSLMVSWGQGTHLFVLDAQAGAFVLVEAEVRIPFGAAEYAINASNQNHWHEPVRSYIEDCVRGEDGPLGRKYNMRWVASMVADAYRIFMRGGIFLYPADDRRGYEQGRLRLMYEANPVAFLVEQAGGQATDGINPILDRQPAAPHERTPLIMGSADKVERVRHYHLDLSPPSREAPLFGRRGLLRG